MKERTIKEDILIAINNILNRNKGSKYASLQEIYREVALLRGIQQNEALESQIRGRLQEHCSQYSNYLGKEDVFETKEKNSGWWRNKTTGERKLKYHVFDIIKHFPGIDITTLQKNLLTLIDDELTYGDKLESLTRPGEMKIEQIIRNFVSHKESYKNDIDFILGDDGVTRLYLKNHIIEKMEEQEENPTSQKFVDTVLDEKYLEKIVNDENEVPVVLSSEDKLSISNNFPIIRKSRKNNNRQYIRKSDFETYIKDYQKKLDNGYIAEGLVYEYEKDKLINMGRKDLSEKVVWISREYGDGFGYDIKSYEIVDGLAKEIYIEVKSSSSGLSSDFEMSSNEYKFAMEHAHDNSFKIYRISKRQGKNIGYIIENNLIDDFVIEPSSYKVSIKRDE